MPKVLSEIEQLLKNINSGTSPIVSNAVTCTICQGPGDRYVNRFQCQNNPCHVADLMVGIWSDLTYPEKA